MLAKPLPTWIVLKQSEEYTYDMKNLIISN